MNKIVVLLFYVILTESIVHAESNDSLLFLFNSHDYQKTIELIEKGPDSNTVEMLHLKVNAYMGLNKYQEALAILEKLQANDSTDYVNILNIAECYKNMSNFYTAIEYYKMLLKTGFSNDYVVLQLANCQYNLDKYEYAINYYLQLLNKDTTHFLARQMGNCFYYNDALGFALPYYELALRLNPNDKQSVLKLGSICMKLNQYYQLGIDVTEKYIKTDSTNFKINVLNGMLYFKNEEYTKTINRMNNCLLLCDSSISVFRYLGLSHFMTGNFKNAIPAIENCLKIDTANIEMHFVLAKCYKKLDNPKSIEHFKKVLDILVPEDEDLIAVYKELYEVFSNTRLYDEALTYINLILELDPDNYEFIGQKAICLYNKKNLVEAKEIFNEFLEKTQDSDGNSINNEYSLKTMRQYAEYQINKINEKIFWEGERKDSLQ